MGLTVCKSEKLFFKVFVLDEPSAFFAEELFAAVEGLGTKDSKLQFIFSTRAEVYIYS